MPLTAHARLPEIADDVAEQVDELHAARHDVLVIGLDLALDPAAERKDVELVVLDVVEDGRGTVRDPALAELVVDGAQILQVDVEHQLLQLGQQKGDAHLLDVVEQRLHELLRLLAQVVLVVVAVVHGRRVLVRRQHLLLAQQPASEPAPRDHVAGAVEHAADELDQELGEGHGARRLVVLVK